MLGSEKLYQIEKNNEDILRIVLTNTVKMLTERGLLNKEKYTDNVKKLTESDSQTMVYQIASDNPPNESYNTIVIKILPHKITAINKSSGIGDFLNKYLKNHKIIIVKDIGKKAYQFITNSQQYSDTEIFLEEDLMINLTDHEYVPKHEVLSEEEAKSVLEVYMVTKKNMPKIYNTDPVARYYNMKPGHICRILRPSETVGFSVHYRLVVKGSVK